MSTNHQPPIPDVNDANTWYFRMLISADNEYNIYNKYYPCLTTTNEYQQILQTKKFVTHDSNVLTVTGSGEQPLFFKLFGAKHVLTFDISYHSYLMTQLKITALKTFRNTKDYYKFLYDMHNTEDTEFLESKIINSVIQNLNKTEKDYFYKMVQKIRLFYTRDNCDLYTISNKDYKKLRENQKEPFDFIWTDIIDLDKKVNNNTFDIVYYSNICNFLRQRDFKRVLQKTQTLLKPHGKLFLITNECQKDLTLETVGDCPFTQFESVNIFPKKLGFYLVVAQTR